jgi:hypothetical protein
MTFVDLPLPSALFVGSFVLLGLLVLLGVTINLAVSAALDRARRLDADRRTVRRIPVPGGEGEVLALDSIDALTPDEAAAFVAGWVDRYRR